MDPRASEETFQFSGGGVSGALVRATEWTKTPLGHPRSWPVALVAYVRSMLHTRQPMCIFWGPELINLYNDGFLPILGEKHPLAMGQSAPACWQEAWPIVGPQIERVMQGENVYFEEVLVPIARAGLVADAWWNYSYSPLFDDGGAVGGALVICTEVTSEVVTRRNLESANRAKDQFLATVSHELRTPLTAILGWARILAETTDRPRLEKGIAIIERNARAQAKIIDDILDVSRIISGKLRLSPSPVRVADLVQAAVDSLRPAAAAKQVELRIEVDARAELYADEDRLQQVVWNLLSNAVKFTPRGGQVDVEAKASAGQVVIRVRDTGRGISQAFLPYVFDRFRQDDASTTKQPGLGLGLAIVRHLVELHGGTVSAASEGEGRGATFEVTFPIVSARPPMDPPVTPAPPEEHTGEAAAAGDTLRGVCVLVVDDQHDARELVATVLEDAGAHVLQAASTAAAAEILAHTDVSVIVSDIGMPGGDGYAFLEHIRASNRTRDIPALALTAYTRAEDRDRALASGFSSHVAKPIEPARLVRCVVALLRS